jgi:hypothetical protein
MIRNMQHTIRVRFIFALLIFSTQLFSQKEIKLKVESQYLYSSKTNLQPFYQYTNQWGVVSAFEQSQGLFIAGLQYQLLDKRNIQLDMGTSGVLRNKTDDSFLHEAYIKGKLFNFIDISLGKHAWSPVSYNDQLTVGGFMRNANARPIPRAQIGIFDYWPVGFLNEAIEIKGGLSHGLLNDDRTSLGLSNEANDVQVHEKWAYIKAGKIKVQPYIGLFHGALMGGERASGAEIGTDYWATFFAKGSEEIGGGEATNTAGAHDGFWDIGLYFNNEVGNFHFYLQKPFADGSGMKIYNRTNHDYKIGVLAQLHHVKWIKNVSVELIKTNYQSGEGIPDPIYPEGTDKAGQIIFISAIEDCDAFMLTYFGEDTDGYTTDDVKEYLEINQNHGLKYGGRDDYNNNYVYYNAWTYQKQAMGLPLYHTYWQAKAYAPNWNSNKHGVFVNNRIRGVHLGLEGEVLEGLTWLFKASYTNNKGAYAEEYIKRYSWEEDEEFYYKGGKKQVYTNMNLSYKSKHWKNTLIKTSFSWDAGELYHAFGCMVGISIHPSLAL